MHEVQAWILDAHAVWIALGALFGAVLIHGLWRSRDDATQNPIRESGPIH